MIKIFKMRLTIVLSILLCTACCVHPRQTDGMVYARKKESFSIPIMTIKKSLNGWAERNTPRIVQSEDGIH